jgi:transposase
MLPMMGFKTVEPKLYFSFSLDQAVPATHLVRRLADVVDFGFVHSLVRRYYSHTGRPSVDPEVLFKLSLLGYLFNITSERRLCEEAGLNLAWRWFLGYELDEAIPDHSVLTKARRRFGPGVYEHFFRHIVQLCEARGLVQGDVLFIDSTLIKANASEKTFRSKALLHQLPQPERYVAEVWAVNEDEEEPSPPRPKKRAGRPRSNDPYRRKSRSVTNELNVSSTDPDAQMFRKPGKPAMLSHKVQMIVDGGRANVVTAVDVRPSCEGDTQAVPTMLVKHEMAVGRSPRELVGDRGYGSENSFKACLARGIQPTLGFRDFGNNTGGFNRREFVYDAERDIFICPQGEELRHYTDDFPGRQAIYRPTRGTCQSCPLKAQCAPGRSDRAVSRRWDAELWDSVKAHLESRHGRRLLRQRQIISERAFADAKEKHGLDRAQFRGRAKVRIQALFTASVINIKKLLRHRLQVQSGQAALVRLAVWSGGKTIDMATTARVDWIVAPVLRTLSSVHVDTLPPIVATSS